MMALAEAQSVVRLLDRFLEVASTLEARPEIAGVKARLAAGMGRAFTALGNGFVRLLSDEESSWPFGWQDAYDRAARQARPLFAQPLTDAVTGALEAGARSAIGASGVDLEYQTDRDTRALGFIVPYVSSVVDGILETTKGYVRTIVDTAQKAGMALRQGISAIRDRFRGFVRPPAGQVGRAEAIAANEVGGAASQGQEWAAADLTAGGIEMEKSWVTMRDGAVEADCLANEDAGWIPAPARFPTGMTRPLAHFGCRCSLAYRRRL